MGFFLVLLAISGGPVRGASFFERLGRIFKSADSAASLVPGAELAEEQVIGGLKEALAQGIERAVAALGREDGFFRDLTVRVPMPESLQRLESGLRRLGQDKVADEFVLTMNRAAEKATPQAAQVLADAVRKMTLDDARSILSGTNNAATQYFRRTSQTNLEARLRPIVEQATAETGVTSAYKALLGKAGPFASLLGSDATDLDGYVTRRALDGLFLKMADEEKRIREDPAARTTELLKKVFGSTERKPGASGDGAK